MKFNKTKISSMVIILFIIFLNEILAQNNSDLKGDKVIKAKKSKPWQILEDKTLSLIILALIPIAITFVFIFCCFICFCYCCRKPKSEELIVTPSELVQMGATPSDMRTANITPEVLKESGASYKQMAVLGATPSQLVETGAQERDLKDLGATQSQLSHVGFKHKKKQKEDIDSDYNESPRRRSKSPIISEYDRSLPINKTDSRRTGGRQTTPEYSAHSGQEPKSPAKRSRTPFVSKGGHKSNIGELIKSMTEKVKTKKSTKTPEPVTDDYNPSPATEYREKTETNKKPVADDSMSVAMGAYGSTVTTAHK